MRIINRLRMGAAATGGSPMKATFDNEDVTMADNSGSQVLLVRPPPMLPPVPIELTTSRPALPAIRVSGDIPSPRSGHIILCDQDGDNLYVFGGYHDGRCFNDLCRYHIASRTWHAIDCTGTIPTQRVSHQGVILGEFLYIFGGSNVPFGHSNTNDFYMCNLRTGHWGKLETYGQVPCPRYGHSLVAHNNKLYLFGGTSGCVYFNDMYWLDLETRTWTRQLDEDQPNDPHTYTTNATTQPPVRPTINPNRPSPRYRHEAVANQKSHTDTNLQERMFIIGGGVPNPPRASIEVHSYEFATGKWTRHVCVPTQDHADGGGLPIARRSHTCVLYESNIYMFGGTDGASMFDDFWFLDLHTYQWHRINLSAQSSTARCFHAATATPNGCMYIFGGCADSNGNVRSNEISACYFKMPSLQELCLQAIGSSHLYGQDDMQLMGIPTELMARMLPTTH